MAKELDKKYPGIHKEAFFIVIESAAYFAIHDQRKADELPDPKQRSRTVEKVHRHSKELISAISELDEETSYYLFQRFEGERKGVKNPDPISARHLELAGIGTKRQLLGSLGLLMKVSDSPIPKPEQVAGRESAARAVEEGLRSFGIEVTTSNTGFAATCLRLAFELAGFDTDDVRYWLKMAVEKNRA